MEDLLKIPESEDYPKLIREAHRRAAPPCGTPSFVRHVSYWPTAKSLHRGVPTSKTKASAILENLTEDYANSRKEWLAATNAYVRAVQDALLIPNPSAFESTDLDGGLGPIFSKDDEFAKHFNWNGLLGIVRFTLHNEYFEATWILDLSRSPTSAKLAETIPHAFGENGELPKEIETKLGELHEQLTSFKKEAADANVEVRWAKMDSRRNSIASIESFFYERIWTMLDGDLRQQISAASPNDGDKPSGDKESLTNPLAEACERFADFRGLVLDYQDVARIHAVERPEWHRFPGEPRIFSVFESKKHCRGSGTGSTPSDATLANVIAPATTALEHIFPFMEAGTNGPNRVEFVACTVLDGRGIYLSSLGNRGLLLDDRQRKAPRPLKYLFLMASVDRWQVGRLVDRINTLGALRLIALRDYDAIKVASVRIRLLGRVLDHLFLQSAEPDGVSEDELAQVFPKLTELSQGPASGLSHRITRSRYYADRLDRLLPGLRIHRIEGWQPYDDFVHRRLFTIYDFIARAGERYEAIGRRAIVLLNLINTKASLVNAKASLDTMHSILRFQAAADILVLVAGTYYFYAILESFLPKTNEISTMGNVILCALCLAEIYFLKRAAESWRDPDPEPSVVDRAVGIWRAMIRKLRSKSGPEGSVLTR